MAASSGRKGASVTPGTGVSELSSAASQRPCAADRASACAAPSDSPSGQPGSGMRGQPMCSASAFASRYAGSCRVASVWWKRSSIPSTRRVRYLSA